jgi:serine protease Do
MDEIQLLDAVERYLADEMTPAERTQFEQLRKSNAEVDQLVVEHTIFLTQLNEFGDRRQFRSILNETHNQLLEKGAIKQERPKTRVVDIVRRYGRVWAVAASIAGIIAVTISGLVAYFTPTVKPAIENLSKELVIQKGRINALVTEVKDVKDVRPSKSSGNDGKGLLLTNAHVVKDAKTVIVQSKGQEYNANVLFLDLGRDLAILKIADDDYKPVSNLPYGFKKSGADLGEQIFTLGFPRDEIVYGEGYMSAGTGYNGDTMSYQIAVAANPGNSGSPIFNKNGEVVGILSTRQLQTQGFVFAVRAKSFFQTLDELKKDSSNYQNIKINTVSSLKGMERTQQIKKIEDCVFLVKTY